ncbi:shock factor protein [Seminavis robusta]|uniref:Shock factor protein n=1 Tax=Seminavis robusta TaxID=568900 RepID=A0A9N8D9K5_9STRA|nr:shock factor protein [Seminavis robusta]|eukprot:Sro53_g031420.1 shock factor protein (410) ;mRNA; f:80540-82006
MLPTKRILHAYEDFAEEAAALEAQQKPWSHGAPGPNDPFPVQLHWMLEQTEKNGFPHVVSWAPHGRSFVVHQRDQFVKEVLPVYFNQSKITSFQRQLSLYGFKRITKGPDSGGYYHPKFLRISRTFARNIVRTKVKNDGPRKAASPSDEPDFYAMPSLPNPSAEAPKIKEANETSVAQASPRLTFDGQHALLLARELLKDDNHQIPTMNLQPRSSASSSLPDATRPLFPSIGSATTTQNNAFGASGSFIQNRILARPLIGTPQHPLQRQLGSRTRSWPSLVDLAATRSSFTASSSPTWLRSSPPSQRSMGVTISDTSMLLPPMPQLRLSSTTQNYPTTPLQLQPAERELLNSALLARGRLPVNTTPLTEAEVSELILRRQQQRSHSFPPIRPGSSNSNRGPSFQRFGGF